MSDITPKKFREMREAYASVYSKTNDVVDSDVLSEEELFENFYGQIDDLFTDLNKQELTEQGRREALMQGLKAIWGLARPVIKQTTGMGTQPKTKLGRAVRAAQTATVPATVLANPGGVRDMAVGAVTGALRGGAEGAYQAQQEREKREKERRRTYPDTSGYITPGGEFKFTNP